MEWKTWPVFKRILGSTDPNGQSFLLPATRAKNRDAQAFRSFCPKALKWLKPASGRVVDSAVLKFRTVPSNLNAPRPCKLSLALQGSSISGAARKEPPVSTLRKKSQHGDILGAFSWAPRKLSKGHGAISGARLSVLGSVLNSFDFLPRNRSVLMHLSFKKKSHRRCPLQRECNIGDFLSVGEEGPCGTHCI